MSQVARTQQGGDESAAPTPLTRNLLANGSEPVAGGNSPIQPTDSRNVHPFDPEPFNLRHGGSQEIVDGPSVSSRFSNADAADKSNAVSAMLARRSRRRARQRYRRPTREDGSGFYRESTLLDAKGPRTKFP